MRDAIVHVQRLLLEVLDAPVDDVDMLAVTAVVRHLREVGREELPDGVVLDLVRADLGDLRLQPPEGLYQRLALLRPLPLEVPQEHVHLALDVGVLVGVLLELENVGLEGVDPLVAEGDVVQGRLGLEVLLEQVQVLLQRVHP